MKIWLLWVGKTKDRRLSELINDYLHRLAKYAKYEVVEIKEVRAGVDTTLVQEAEAKMILNSIVADAYTVALGEEGEALTSHMVAHSLVQYQNIGTRHLVFIIGGHTGLAPRVKDRVHKLWSLSALTFTHEMARLILIEQLYRAYTIIHGHPYQK